MKIDRRIATLMAIIMVIGIPLGSAVAGESPEGDKWQFGAALYLWGASMGGESAGGADIDIGFDDIIKNLNFALMGAVAAKKGRWSFMADVIYLDMESGSNSAAAPILILDDVEMESWIISPSAAYRALEDDWGRLDLLAGARVTSGLTPY